jgi:hypothetical protein
MYPIKGMVMKQNHFSPWVVYDKYDDQEREEYRIVGAFPPYPTPSRSTISDFFV